MQLNRQEMATVLAALRHWQLTVSPATHPADLQGHFDGNAPLMANQIDQLCERLNAYPRPGKFRFVDPDGDTLDVGYNYSFGHLSVTLYAEEGVRMTCQDAARLVEVLNAIIAHANDGGGDDPSPVPDQPG